MYDVLMNAERAEDRAIQNTGYKLEV